jgi:hypothetical protein
LRARHSWRSWGRSSDLIPDGSSRIVWHSNARTLPRGFWMPSSPWKPHVHCRRLQLLSIGCGHQRTLLHWRQLEPFDRVVSRLRVREDPDLSYDESWWKAWPYILSQAFTLATQQRDDGGFLHVPNSQSTGLQDCNPAERHL